MESGGFLSHLKSIFSREHERGAMVSTGVVLTGLFSLAFLLTGGAPAAILPFLSGILSNLGCNFLHGLAQDNPVAVIGEKTIPL